MIEILRRLGHMVGVLGNLTGGICWVLAALDLAYHDQASDYSGAMLLFFIGSVCFVLGTGLVRAALPRI